MSNLYKNIILDLKNANTFKKKIIYISNWFKCLHSIIYFLLLYVFYKKYKSKILLKYRILSKVHRKTIVHFLHIGKTGGTSIIYALKNKEMPYITDNHILFSHPHKFCIDNTLKGEKVFFFIRDTIDRFISGFYARKNKDLPRYFNEWNSYEKKAFSTFSTPNKLAISLSSKNEDIRQKAIQAMNNISHVNTSYWDWFENKKYFLSRIHDIIFVGKQKTLSQDFEQLKKILNLPGSISLPESSINSHKNTDSVDKNLDPEAIKNLKNWYTRDYEFLKLLRECNLI